MLQRFLRLFRRGAVQNIGVVETYSSAAFEYIAYNSLSMRLQIAFRRNNAGGRRGIYTYENVSQTTVLQFVSAPSMGFFYNQFIKDMYSLGGVDV